MRLEKNISEKIKKNEETIYSLDKEFKIGKDARSMSIPGQPSYMPSAILGICKKGKATVKVYLDEHTLVEGELIVILPGQVASIKDISSDFSISYFVVSESLINDTVLRISRISPLFFIYIRKKHYYKLSENEIYRYTQYYNLVESRLNINDNSFQREYVVSILSLFYLDLYSNYKNKISISDSSISDRRKEQLTFEFFQLILQHYRKNREVAFYAQKMFITPKYLSTVIKEVSGRAAKDWIIEYTMLEIKSLLKNSTLNIQEITVTTNFSNQASLGRFFKKHTGMTPSEYKKLKEMQYKR